MKQKIKRYIRRSISLASGWFFAAMTSAILISGEAFAAGEKPATKLVNVVDTTAMAPGFAKWIADIYNSNLWLYGLIVVVIMAVMGTILGLAFDQILVLLGIDLGKLEHHE